MGKKVAVISGGGSKGSWQVGCLKALLESGRAYDSVIGVSVGALNSTFLAQHDKEKQLESISELEDIWMNLSGDDAVFKRHAPSFLTYIWALWKGGIYDMSPLRSLIQEKLDINKLYESKTDLTIGVCSLNTGKYKSVKKIDDNIIDYIWASCVFPILFSPAEVDGEMYVDGGIRHQIPLLEVFRIPEVDEVDIILTSPSDGHIHDVLETGRLKNLINVAPRCAGIMSDEVYVNDLYYCAGPNPIKINVWEPEKEVNKDSFRFDKEEIKRAIQQGYEETKAKLNV